MTSKEQPLYRQAIDFVVDVANGRHPLSKLIPPVLLLIDAALCLMIIWKVPYTEIDWIAYMQQIAQYVSGERDYTKIEGATGPLVYPAAHVYIYSVLYSLTDEGKDIFLAQQLFAILYLATLATVMACYWQAKAPSYIYPLLILSKRLHSIFVLRCFNDCFAVFFLWLAIYFFQKRSWASGAVTYSWGLGIKMSLLLALPAVGIILLLGRGLTSSLRLALLMVQVQVAIGLPFLTKNAWGYLGRAFELSRQFLFKWTVNWRFVGQEAFLSRPFSLFLLGLHLSALVTFITTKWLKPARKSITDLVIPILLGKSPFTEQEERAISRTISPRYILTTMLSANAIGLLFARSLHYQFYAYIAWSTPFLLWRSGVHPVIQYALWFVQEWAWNVFPSTPISSGVVVGVLALTVALVWWGAREEWEVQPRAVKDDAAKR